MQVPEDDVRDLLAAIRDAADPGGLDYPEIVRHMVTIQVRVADILVTAELDAGHPDVPGMTPQAIAAATAALRKLAGGES